MHKVSALILSFILSLAVANKAVEPYVNSDELPEPIRSKIDRRDVNVHYGSE